MDRHSSPSRVTVALFRSRVCFSFLFFCFFLFFLRPTYSLSLSFSFFVFRSSLNCAITYEFILDMANTEHIVGTTDLNLIEAPVTWRWSHLASTKPARICRTARRIACQLGCNLYGLLFLRRACSSCPSLRGTMSGGTGWMMPFALSSEFADSLEPRRGFKLSWPRSKPISSMRSRVLAPLGLIALKEAAWRRVEICNESLLGRPCRCSRNGLALTSSVSEYY